MTSVQSTAADDHLFHRVLATLSHSEDRYIFACEIEEYIKRLCLKEIGIGVSTDDPNVLGVPDAEKVALTSLGLLVGNLSDGTPCRPA